MGVVEENLKIGLSKTDTTFIAHSADIVGNVKLGKDVTVWYNTTLRGDINTIEIGDGSNVQDGTTVHVGYVEPVVVGKNCTIGHGVILHGTRVHDNCLIGMGAILLNGSVIEENTIVAAGSLVPQNKVLKGGALYMGSPAKYVRDLTPEDIEKIKKNGEEYVHLGQIYREKNIK